ncbi:MAG: sulfatase [Alphaproteobacteria bacterium]|nr:sulfatase [Alphaproteobacteria bacterium]
MIALLAALALGCVAPRAEVPPRGVILIVVDTLRADALGPEATPFIDGLAREGRVFTDHVANSSWTKPSMASLYTGQLPAVHGVMEVDARLPDGALTVAERFRAAGFRTAAVVANPLLGRAHGLAQGFETLWEPDGDPPYADALVAQALPALEDLQGEPFFLVIALFDPHAPYAPPPRWRARTCGDCPLDALDDPQREYAGPGPSPAERRQLRGLYAGEVAAVDDALRTLWVRLEAAGLLERSVVVLTSDHGEAFGEHKVYGHAFHMWDEVLRVPLIVTNGPPAGVSDSPTQHLDLAPTLLALGGLPHDDLPGVDLLAPGLPQESVRIADVRMYGVRRISAREGALKATWHAPVDAEAFARFYDDPGRYPSVERGGGRWEVFDLVADPEERHPLGAPPAHLREAIRAYEPNQTW